MSKVFNVNRQSDGLYFWIISLCGRIITKNQLTSQLFCAIVQLWI